MHRKIFSVLLFFTLFPLLIQAGNTGRIKGKVTDLSTGEPLIGANVLVVGTTFGAATDANGIYIIRNLDPSNYTIKASYLGYKTVTISNVVVNVDLTTEVNFQLPGKNISVGTVQIVAKRPLIRKDATSSIRIATSEEIQNLPVRGLTNIAELQAGVVNYNGVIHIRGGRGDAVGYYLDGISITNPETGHRAITISNNAIQEIAVETGGFTAEYGGSTAGLIRTQLKSGGPKFHASFEYITDNISLEGKGNFRSQNERLGAYWYGNNESSLSLSGPVYKNKIKFFYNLDYKYDGSLAHKGYPGFNYGYFGAGLDKKNPENNDSLYLFYPKGIRQNNKRQYFTHSGTVTLDFNPISIRLSGVFSSGWNDVGGTGVTEILRNRVSVDNWTNGMFSLKFTHVLSPKLFYAVNAGFSFNNFDVKDPYLGNNYWSYGDSLANAQHGIFWKRKVREINGWRKSGVLGNGSRYLYPTPLNIYGWNFNAPLTISANHSKGELSSINARFDLTYLPNKHNTLKIGGNYQKYTDRFWGVGGQVGFAYGLYDALNGIAKPTEKQILDAKAKMLYKAGVDNYGYDIYGNKYDGSGFDAPHKPVQAGIYVEDKIEYSDIILNLGLRYDYFDMDNLQLRDPAKPETGIGDVWTKGKLNMEGFKKVPTFSSISPRFSVSFPVTDRTVFHAGYGKYVQQPGLNSAYLGYHRLAFEIGQSYFFPNPTGANLRPIRKTHYEVGFRQQLTDYMAFDLTGYYDDISGQVTFNQQQMDRSSRYTAYQTMMNGDFATTKGVELQITMRRYQRLSGKVSLSFEDAKGTGSFPNSNAGIVGAPLDGVTVFRPQYVSPLTYERPFHGNVFLDYRFGPNDGPVLLHGFGVSVLATFGSGHPFTRGIGGAAIESDARFRMPIEPLNASITPSRFNVDLKVDKTVNIWNKLSTNFYVRVLNLFNTKNVLNVYIRSGAANNDGYISNPSLGGKLVETYGPIYKKLYDTLNIDYNGFYSNARQILFGIRLEY